MVNDATMKLKCGEVLHLQPVSQAIISGLSSKMLARVMNKPGQSRKVAKMMNSSDLSDAQVLELFGDDVGMLAAIGDKLFDYCAGWGVTDNPPKSAGELIRLLLGNDDEGIHLRRAAWVRTLLADDQEGWDLVNQVQALSREPEPTEVSEAVELQARIAELEAKLQETPEA